MTNRSIRARIAKIRDWETKEERMHQERMAWFREEIEAAQGKCDHPEREFGGSDTSCQNCGKELNALRRSE